MRLRHVALATLVMAIWGFNFVVIKVGLDSIPPFLFVSLRYLVAAVPAVFLVGRPVVSWRWILTIGSFIGIGQFGLLFLAMHLGMPAGLSSLVLQLQAPFTIVLAVVLLREHVRPVQIAGLTIAFAGIALVGLDLGAAAPVLAFGLCILAAAMWAFANICVRRSEPTDMLNLMAWTSLVPILPMLALSLLVEGPAADLEALRSMSWTGIGALIYLGYPATLLGWAVWGWLIRRYNASRVAPYTLLVPVFGMTSGALVLDESFGLLRFVAAVLVVGGIALATLRIGSRSRARPAKKPTTAVDSEQHSDSLP